MPIEHTITQSDTLYSLALEYLGDSARWREVADFNRLSPPYLVETHEEKLEKMYGKGFVTVLRSSSMSPITVRKGWRFKTKPYVVGGMVKEFEVTEDVTLPPGVPLGFVPARSLIPGSYGNVTAGLVSELGKGFIENGISFDAVGNQEDFEGGSDDKILTVGDSVYIPIDEEDESSVGNNLQKELQYLGGEDLALEYGALSEDGFGDLKSVSGLENIERAIHDRLTTEKGEYPLHPEYGTDLAEIIGNPQSPYYESLAEVEVYEALALEDRIENVSITRLTIEGTTVHLELSYRPVVSTREASLSLELNYNYRGV